jgi:fumarylacetoacetase
MLESWVESANGDTDFPLKNLPFGRFHCVDAAGSGWRFDIAIGNQVLDLQHAGLIEAADMQRLLQLAPAARRELRQQLSAGLARGSRLEGEWRRALRPMAQVELGLPCAIGDYTDFYVGIHHATAVGPLFRPDNPLLPNYR